MLRTLGPNDRVAVIVWVGYRTPWGGFLESFSRTLAELGAIDLARLTRILPRSAHVTLVGHSYGGRGVRTRSPVGASGRLRGAG